MYWQMGGSVLLLAAQALLWAVGGSLLAVSVFRIERDRILITGISLGLVLHLVLGNLLARLGSVQAGFWTAAVLVLLLGMLAQHRSRIRLPRVEIEQLQPLLWLVGITILITWTGRGLEIFDDRKNLALISSMAAGNIPPQFYMNPDFHFSYHYGFQLFAANLMRSGGLFPWSAFDLAKGFTAALSVMLCYTWAKGFTRSSTGGMWAAFLLLFASGSRWLLLFVPQSLLLRAGENITFWGINVLSGDNLLEALTSAWVLHGGPPFPVPFAYNSGIFPPFILSAQAGPRSLGLIAMFLVIILIPHLKRWEGTAVLAAVFALWALAAEATFGLFLAAFLLFSILVGTGSVKKTERHRWQLLLAALVFGGLLSIFQGGTFTEMARDLFFGDSLAAKTAAGGSPFSLRFPPAIVSSHLGSLSLTDPLQLLVGLLEMGVALLMIPVVLQQLREWLKMGDSASVLLALSAFTGILLPLFLEYDVDRDITRMSTHGLGALVLLSLPAIIRWTAERGRQTAALLQSGWTALLCFGGLVVAGSLFTAVPVATFGDEITPLDAAITLDVWDQLEPGALVLDSHPWRSVVITGRLIRSSLSSSTPLPAWEQLVADPDPSRAAAHGYGYILMDDAWWERLTQDQHAALGESCVQLLLEKHDNCAGCGRRLYDIRSCAGGQPAGSE